MSVKDTLIPQDLLVRLMAAIETPEDLTEPEVSDLLAEADRYVAYMVDDEDESC